MGALCHGCVLSQTWKMGPISREVARQELVKIGRGSPSRAKRRAKASGASRASRLWAVFRALIENEHGPQMDERKEREAIALAGQVPAQVDAPQSLQPPSSLRSRLLPGLTSGTQDEGTFGRAYDAALVAAATADAQKK